MVHDHMGATRRSSRPGPAAGKPPCRAVDFERGVLPSSTMATRRVARVAAEAASRFAGADVAGVAMEWMVAPRALFGGLSAVEACVDQVHCRRAVTLHGLEMDLEADADDVDLVMAPSDDEGNVAVPGGCSIELPGRGLSQLFVAEIADEEDGAGVWAFGAMVAEDESHVRCMLKARFGARLAASSLVRQGFDGRVGLARTLVSSALAEMLGAVAEDPNSPLARGFEVVVEQRFHA